MPRHSATPDANWAGVRGPVIITVVLLLLSPFALFAARFQRQRQAVEYERAIMIQEVDRARHEVGTRPAVRTAPPGRD